MTLFARVGVIKYRGSVRTESIITGGSSAPAAYSITASAATVNEGSSVSFEIASNRPLTTVSVSLLGITLPDLATGSLNRTIVLDGSGSAIFTVELSADVTTEGLETLTARVDANGATASVQVIDTSQSSAVYSITPTAANVNEGASVTFNIASNRPNTTINVLITGITLADLSTGTLSRSVALNGSGAGAVVVALAGDLLTEGAETLTLSIVGAAVSSSVTVNDTSKTPAALRMATGEILLLEAGSRLLSVSGLPKAISALPVLDNITGDEFIFAIRGSTVARATINDLAE